MSKYTFRDGTTVEWTGKNISICTKCDEIFNSVTAFDAHIKDGEHDASWMPRNNRGYLVTALNTQQFDEYDDEEGDITLCPSCDTELYGEDLTRLHCPYCGEKLDGPD